MEKKTLLLLLLGVFWVSSCKKEDDTVITTPETLLKENYHIDCDSIKKMIPLNLINSQKVVFVNELGEVKKFKVVVKEVEEERTFQGVKYTIECLYLLLVSDSNSEFSIGLSVSANFVDANKFSRVFSINYRPWDITSNTSFTYLVNSKGQESIIGDFVKSKTFLGKTFSNVYSSPKWNNIPKSSEVSFNSEFGIISFKDVTDDDLFVFDSFE